ncbi:NADPH dehydrogenase NamA [Bacillaceae bacterium SIJ1]|uniref:NADPH dehydrogenase NamA n=1 Tax=Litoribacterium kuwaitense TaxID=1398745 RepID=UPI0013EB0D35|nr:NADPH dehydrogenase NamA [Litoribacterium kuwaitense]
MTKLFSPYTIKNVTLKNRIVMSPMCMYSCIREDGKITNWHRTHYTSRAVGQAGLIMLEATAVQPEGRISTKDLGIWSDEHVEGLTEIVALIHEHDSKAAIQLAHAGRKSTVPETIYGPSPLPFNDHSKQPAEMTLDDIQNTIISFKQAAARAKEAGFDVIEIHAAHGYLLHSFLTPLANHRTDAYGGTAENRYRILGEVIEAVKSEWSGPLFVRISASDHHSDGLDWQDYVPYVREMNTQGVDVIDCSSGGAVETSIEVYPGYQVPYADGLRREGGVPTGAVGLITTGKQAEEILRNERADLIFLARALLVNPYWPLEAARDLNVKLPAPDQYDRAW